MAEACLCLAAAAGPQIGMLESADLKPNAHYAMHVSCLKHLSELVEWFHKAHAGQDVLLSYPCILRDDISDLQSLWCLACHWPPEAGHLI